MFGRYMLVVMVAGAIMALLTRTARGAAIAAILIAGLLLYRAGTRKRMQLSVTPVGISWIHPDRGGGEMKWSEIGALVVRDVGAGQELAVYLVPPGGGDPEESGYFAGFILTTADLGRFGAAGEAKIREFVVQIWPYLKPEINIDRGTRRWLEKWGVGPAAGRT